MAKNDLFDKDLKVINIGLSSFKDTIEEVGADVVQVDWKPPAEVYPKILKIITDNSSYIEKSNKKCLKKILTGTPFLVDIDRAIDVIPGMKKNMILHAGPPIIWDRMCGPMRGAIIGALIYEGMAENPEEAEKIAASEKIEYSPCHEHIQLDQWQELCRLRCLFSFLRMKSTEIMHTAQ